MYYNLLLLLNPYDYYVIAIGSSGGTAKPQQRRGQLVDAQGPGPLGVEDLQVFCYIMIVSLCIVLICVDCCHVCIVV